MNIILIGYGNVGKALHQVISANGLTVDTIVRMSGIYSDENIKIGEVDNFSNYLNKGDAVVFITVPSKGDGQLAASYYMKTFESGASVVTCEKAFLASHWSLIMPHIHQIQYSATVGGGSGILNAINDYVGDIQEIRAVVNGTLNYIGDRLWQGVSQESVYEEVLQKGFAEPGSQNFNEVIENELQDVLYKTVILANHSKLFPYSISLNNVIMSPYRAGLRCSVFLNKTEVMAGYIPLEDHSWFPERENNALCINKQKIVEGPGAGSRITAERMFKDFQELVNND
jgi:homoserine dehydrogenase